jgi:hypothetical protein
MDLTNLGFSYHEVYTVSFLGGGGELLKVSISLIWH